MTEFISPLLSIAGEYLKLKNTKESRKYLDKLIWLKKEIYVEENKSEDSINHARIDNLNSELRILIESIATLGAKNS